MLEYFKSHILEMMVIMSVPFVMLIILRRFKIFKKKPYLFYGAMVIPTIITAHFLLPEKLQLSHVKSKLLHLLVDQKGLPLWVTTASAKGNKHDQLAITQIKSTKAMTIYEADKGYIPVIGYRKHRKERASTTEITDFFWHD